MKVLLIGVGYVTSELASLLLAEGHEVWGISRHHQPMIDGLVPLKGDVTRPRTLQNLPSQPDQVVFAISPDSRTAQAYRESYLSGAECLREALPNSRLLMVSSTSVYGQENGEIVSDTTPVQPKTETAAVLCEAEKQILGGNNLVLRAAGIYGPGRGRLLSKLAAGRIDEKDLDAWTNRIHRTDLARAIHFLIKRPSESGAIVASDQEPAQLRTMMHWVQDQLNERTRRSLARRASKASDNSSPSKRSLAASGARRKSRRIIARRLQELGFSYEFPSFRQGYEPLLETLEQ